MRNASVGKAPPSRKRRDDLRLLVGPAAAAYVRTFDRFGPGIDFVPIWNWPAALFGELWFAYRKMYGLAAGILVVDLAMLWGFQQVGWSLWMRFLVWFALLGPTANWLYCLHATRLLRRIRARYTPGDEAEDMMRLEGGASIKAVVLVVVLAVFAQPVLEGRMVENEIGVFHRDFELTAHTDLSRLFFW